MDMLLVETFLHNITIGMIDVILHHQEMTAKEKQENSLLSGISLLATLLGIVVINKIVRKSTANNYHKLCPGNSHCSCILIFLFYHHNTTDTGVCHGVCHMINISNWITLFYYCLLKFLLSY